MDYKLVAKEPTEFEFTWLADVPEEEKRKVEDIASLKEPPIIVSGQRSSIVPSSAVPGYEGIQIKGHLFREDEEHDRIQSPRTEIYNGRGNPRMHAWVNKQGEIITYQMEPQPKGFMLMSEIRKNMDVIETYRNVGIPIGQTLGFGIHKGDRFVPGDKLEKLEGILNSIPKYLYKPQPVGCMLLQNPRSDEKRGHQMLLEICNGLDNQGKHDFMKNFFTSYGMLVRDIVDAGMIYFGLTLDNITIAENDNFFKISPGYSIAVHDPGIPYMMDELKGPINTGYTKKGMGKKQWNSNMLLMFDITITCDMKWISEPEKCYKSLNSDREFVEILNGNGKSVQDRAFFERMKMVIDFLPPEKARIVKDLMYNEIERSVSNRSIKKRDLELSTMVSDLRYDPRPDFFRGVFGKLPYGSDFFTEYDNISLQTVIHDIDLGPNHLAYTPYEAFLGNMIETNNAKKDYIDVAGVIRMNEMASALVQRFGKR